MANHPRKPGAAPPADSPSGQVSARIRRSRQERGWSLDRLSSACGVSSSMLSQIERNLANPTLAVVFRIAEAFGLTLAELAGGPGAAPTVRVIRAGERSYHYRSDEYVRIRTLSPLHLEKDVEFYEIELAPGGALRSAAHFAGTREYLTVQKGRVRVEAAGDAELLGARDSASYRADVPHAIINTGRRAAVVYLVDIYR